MPESKTTPPPKPNNQEFVLTIALPAFVKSAVGLQDAISKGEIVSHGGRYVMIPFGIANAAMKSFGESSEILRLAMEASNARI